MLHRLVFVLLILSAVSIDASKHRGRHHLRTLQSASLSSEMLQAVNAERAKHGLSPLCLNKKLQTAAQRHSQDMATNDYMSHTSFDGTEMGERIERVGFVVHGAAENVAAGQSSVQSVVQSWMESPGHRANILGDYKFLGCGYAKNDRAQFKHYWTQNFGASSEEQCDDDDSTDKPVPTPAPTKPSAPAPRPIEPSQVTPSPTKPTVTPCPTKPSQPEEDESQDDESEASCDDTPRPTVPAASPSPASPAPATPSPTKPQEKMNANDGDNAPASSRLQC